MTEAEKIYVATWALGRGYDYEKTMYSDEMYGKETLINEVWEYVEEAIEIGRVAFREKYKEYELYSGF